MRQPTFAFIHTDTLSKLEYQLMTRRRSMKNSREFIEIWRTRSEADRVSRARLALFKLALSMHARTHVRMHARIVFIGTHGVPELQLRARSCRIFAARDIAMSPLHSFRRRSLASPAFFCVFSPVLYQWFDPSTKYRGVARVCPADGSEVTCCY